MTEELEAKIAELKALKVDTSADDLRIRYMQDDLNLLISARNEKLAINREIDRKIENLYDTIIIMATNGQ